MAKMRRNWYHAQLVTQAEMDESETFAMQGERDAIIDGGHAQSLITDTPDPKTYGGIIKGLVVARHGTDNYVDVSLGRARDRLGRMIDLEVAATVKVTMTGSTTEGDTTDATGFVGAAAVLGGSPGRYVVLSLWIAHDEELAAPEVDASSVTVYTEITESFHFYLHVGASYAAHPPAAPPSVASLTNDAVLLADMVVWHNPVSSAIEVIAVCNSSEDWDTLGGNYIGLAGRRANWLALDHDTDFARFLAMSIEARYGTPREAIYELVKALQAGGALAPSGADLIGSRAMNGKALVETQYADLMVMPAGSLFGQVTALIDRFSDVLYRGGNNTVKPVAGYNGTVYDPSTMESDEALLSIKANVGGTIGNLFRYKARGHICMPNEWVENFNYAGHDVGVRAEVPQTADGYGPWGPTVTLVGGGGNFWLRSLADGTPYIGGVAELLTAGGLGDSVVITQGHNFNAGIYLGGWNLGASPWFTCSFRIYIPDVTNVGMMIGVKDHNGGNSAAWVELDTAVGPNLSAKAADSAGVITAPVSLAAPAVAATWYTCRISSLSNGSLVFQLNNGNDVPIGVAGTFANAGHNFFILVREAGVGAVAKNVCVSQIRVSDGLLEADMI